MNRLNKEVFCYVLGEIRDHLKKFSLSFDFSLTEAIKSAVEMSKVRPDEATWSISDDSLDTQSSRMLKNFLRRTTCCSIVSFIIMFFVIQAL